MGTALATNEVQTGALMSFIEKAAQDPNVDVEKMERMLAMVERVSAKNAEQAFAEAMNEVQQEIRPIAADGNNPQTHSKYATYNALDKKLRPIYTKHGFSLSFDTGEAPDLMVAVLCHVSHKGGHTRTYRALIPADGKGAKGNDVMTKTHAVGSAMSYGMRYLLKLIFNVAIGEDDDDGNMAAAQTVSESQAADLTALVEEVGADVPAFLKYLSKRGKLTIAKIEDIPAVMFKDAVAALEAKRKAK